MSTTITPGSEENWPSSCSEMQSTPPSSNSRRSSPGLGIPDGHADSHAEFQFDAKSDKKKINERARRNDNTELVKKMQNLLIAEDWDSDPLSNPNQRSGLKFNKLNIMREFIGRFLFWKNQCESLENAIMQCESLEQFFLLREQLCAQKPLTSMS